MVHPPVSLVARAALIMWLLSAVAGCGGGGGSSGPTTGRAARYVVVEGPGATEYGTTAEEQPPLDDDAGQLAQTTIEVGAAQGAPLTLDGRLSELAARVGREVVEQGAAPSAEVVQFFARHLGIAEPVPSVSHAAYADLEGARLGLQEQLPALLVPGRFTHLGVATVPHGDERIAVVVLTRRGVDLTPVQRVRSAGPLVLSGNLLGDLRNPEVVVVHPDGHTQRSPAGSGPRFQVRLLLAESGTYAVELLARGSAGITVVANFQLYVDEPAPTRLAVSAADTPGVSTADDVREALIARIAEERRRAGAPELTLHPGLSEVAEAHCRDMVAADFVGHDSPTTGTPAMRLTAAGFASGLMLENVARGYSADELHRGLMDSPGHRANILEPRVTHLGIAVVAVPDGDRTAFLATQVFTQMTTRIDTAAAPAALLAAINEGRRARRTGPVASDELLAQAAQEAAEAYFADPSLSEQDVTDRASAALRRYAIAYRRVGALMTVVTRIEDAGRLEPTFDPDVTTLGIGVAQGDRPGQAPNSIAVVMVLGWPR
ncbi:MAG: CAP domain-containing protein [Myxococcales bacterium]|nr:CAP domain-containing protein [Myxococcales bacterium]